MEDRLVVFVSSAISGMAAERSAARTAIAGIPLTRPWLFELSSASALPLEESYLSKVRSCDIFILLLGNSVTDPVQKEVTTARAAGKPLLVFLSAAAPADTVAYARSLGVKYAAYHDAGDLSTKVAEAVGDELITGYRRYGVPRSDLGPIGAFLDRLAQAQANVTIGGDQIITSGPVATHGSAISTGSGTAIAGNGNVVITGPAAKATRPRRKRP